MGEQSVSLMQELQSYVDAASGFVWGPYLLIPLLVGTGAFLMLRLGFMPFRRLGMAFSLMWKGRRHDAAHEGELSPFNALMTSMAATVGTGNIVGVASAIMIGGPGAVFWMWVTALVGMATKYCEAVLAVKYREVTPDGSYVGGPMYYIRKGLGENWAWMAVLFALFGAVASFGIGNMTQANSITASVADLINKFTEGSVQAAAQAPTGLMASLASLTQDMGGIENLAAAGTGASALLLVIAMMTRNEALVRNTARLLIVVMTVYYVLLGFIAEAMNIPGGLATYCTAAGLLLIIGLVLLGGVKRIGSVAGTLVPFMALFYIIIGIVAIIWNIDKVPGAFKMIFTEAFSLGSVAGGAFGVAIIVTIQNGVARGLFSNEAGLGSAPIAHATAITDSPVRQGFLGMLDPFLDTIVICSITALVVLVTNHWYYVDPATGEMLMDGAHGILSSVKLADLPPDVVQKLGAEGMQALAAKGELNKALLTQRAFSQAIPGELGAYVVAVAQALFAFSTILGWCVYGERCCIYLFGHKSAFFFRSIFTLIVPLGAVVVVDLVWGLADVFNGLMALPNLVALLLLSPVVIKLTREYFKEQGK
ncbi:sodium:alanine symporter family protein [Desulfovibrio sp. OttesenSCG-928-A18]|nr:sodium:alanine symporter family protein [Desulfovibrio sp. OttesenSCG-928-A18]